jgi:hypothetical protein
MPKAGTTTSSPGPDVAGTQRERERVRAERSAHGVVGLIPDLLVLCP